MSDNKQKNEVTDFFGKTKVELNKETVILNLGKNPSNCSVTLIDGTEIPGILHASLELSPELDLYILKLEIINPVVKSNI